MNLKMRIGNRNSLVLLLTVLFISSCIPTKKVVYLEDYDYKGEEEYQTQAWEYKVQSGDRFYIKIDDPLKGIQLGESEAGVSGSESQTPNLIHQAPNLHDFKVSEDGTLDLPLIGKVEAVGKTIPELTQYIKERCKGYISNPTVKLYMTNYNVTLLGEFYAPGFYQLITDNPTIFDAIALGGDLTDFAEREKIKIIRKTDKGTTKVIYIDITDPEFISSNYFHLHPNDIIHVMPLKVKKYSGDNALPLVLSALTTIITIISITTR